MQVRKVPSKLGSKLQATGQAFFSCPLPGARVGATDRSRSRSPPWRRPSPPGCEWCGSHSRPVTEVGPDLAIAYPVLLNNSRVCPLCRRAGLLLHGLRQSGQDLTPSCVEELLQIEIAACLLVQMAAARRVRPRRSLPLPRLPRPRAD